jgi:hypothetical protein
VQRYKKYLEYANFREGKYANFREGKVRKTKKNARALAYIKKK